MPNWMTELENLVKGMGKGRDEQDENDNDEYEGDEDEEGEDDTPAPAPRARKGVTDPKPNAETTNSGGEASVHNPNSLDKRSGGGSAPLRKGIEDVVSEESADAFEVSSVLGDLAKGINALAAAGANDPRIASLERRIANIEKGQEVIGMAVTKSLSLQADTMKSLREDVEQIGKQPAGRKSITKSVERNFPGNNEDAAPALPTANEIMVKSLQAVKAGTITAQQASSLETARQTGKWNEAAHIWNRIKD